MHCLRFAVAANLLDQRLRHAEQAQALDELEQLVQKMEKGEMSLDEGGEADAGPLFWLGAALLGVFVLGSLIPSIAVQVRRFHDQDKSGWWVLVLMIGLHSLVEYPLWYAYFLLPTAFAFGLGLFGASMMMLAEVAANTGFVTVAVALWLPRRAKALNALLLGESEARHLGVDVERLKRELVFCTALGVGAAVAAAGMIGFVGLVMPHLVRMLVGNDQRVLLPCTLFGGGIFLVLADTLARSLIAPQQLPVGVVTALIGVPTFLYLLNRSRQQ